MTLPDLAVHDTLPKLLLHNAERHGGDVAMREKEFGIWNAYDWARVRAEIRQLALALDDLGIARGEVVAIIGRNRPNWVWSEWAAQAVGAISLGLY
jgi:long-chain acyl-CoA synthetase